LNQTNPTASGWRTLVRLIQNHLPSLTQAVSLRNGPMFLFAEGDPHMRGNCLAMLAACAALTVSVPADSSAAKLVSFDRHDIRVTLDVPSQQAKVTDRGEVQISNGWNLFLLNASAKIGGLIIAGNPVDYSVMNLADTAQLPAEIKTDFPKIDTEGEPLLVFFETNQSGSVPFEINFQATFADPVENVQFSREKVGDEVRGTIGEQGAYLSPAAYYYPVGDEQLARFRVTVDSPDNWLAVSDGNPMSSVVENGRRIETFENPYVNDGLTVMAAPYVSRMETSEGVEVAAYFFEADTALAAGYVEAAAGYIKMYSDLIGSYPFKRFTIAENFFPTGYGFPAWTLLGQQVLRLPFIKATSLGHEVLHNWWGNSVYVDYERGNWCEGLTVYGADYRYKLMESPAAARDYRKDILKEYASYVDQGNDFPIREFKSRTSAETRTIGYNKAMMVFHMIEKEIGTEPFFGAWRLIYERFKAKQVAWEDWVAAFEETSGKDLSWVIPEWIDRAGAPVISLDSANLSNQHSLPSEPVSMNISKKGDASYHLRVPIRFYYTDPRSSTYSPEPSTFDTVVILEGKSGHYEFEVPGWAGSVEIDPEYHLFRKLYPEEIEPIISAVMGAEKKRFVAYNVPDAGLGLFQAFAVALAEDSSVVESPDVFNSVPKDFAPVILNPTEVPAGLASLFSATDSSITINGTDYARGGHTFVMAGKSWNGFEKYLLILSEDLPSLPRIGQLIPHYGKYSYLVFEGAKNVGKGQWPTPDSPLRKMVGSISPK
jgi:aminopeptidase N